MTKKEIEELYKEKINQLIRLNKSYYELSNPIVDDREYDKLKKDIIDLEKKYGFLDNQYSPSKIVGFKPSKNFKKVLHKVPMLSLANAFGQEDLINFEKKILNYLNLTKDSKIEYSAEPKIDGISASLIYKKGNLVTGLSRGAVSYTHLTLPTICSV